MEGSLDVLVWETSHSKPLDLNLLEGFTKDMYYFKLFGSLISPGGLINTSLDMTETVIVRNPLPEQRTEKR